MTSSLLERVIHMLILSQTDMSNIIMQENISLNKYVKYWQISLFEQMVKVTDWILRDLIIDAALTHHPRPIYPRKCLGDSAAE